MAKTFDLIIRGATCVTESRIGDADVGVRAGRIAEIGDLSQADGEKVIIARGLHLLPGVIDTQVHFREPGLEHKEDLGSGSLAAVMGGVTAVCEMPNTNPPTVNEKRLKDKLARARGRMWCDYAFYIGAAHENIDELAKLERLKGCAGVKVFMGASTGTLLIPDDETLLKVLKSGKRRVAVHAEDQERLQARLGKRVENEPASHAAWRDPETAYLATERIIKLAKKARRPIHVLHVTTRQEMELLAKHRNVATVEVTPQHLTLSAPGCYQELGAYAQMNPPIRDIDHQDGLWNALLAGIVDVVGSDHAPHTIEEKEKPYPGSPSGMPGVQTLLPLLLEHVAQGRMDLHRLVQLTSSGARKVLGIKNKGALETGFDADFSLVDLKAEWRIDKSWLKSKCKWSPFDGMKIHGKPEATIVRGRAVMRSGEILGEARGRPLAFER